MTVTIERYDINVSLRFPYGEEREGEKIVQPDVAITVASLMTNAPEPGIFRVVRLQLSNVVMVQDVDAFDLRREDGEAREPLARFEAAMRDMPLTVYEAHTIRMTVRSTGGGFRTRTAISSSRSS